MDNEKFEFLIALENVLGSYGFSFPITLAMRFFLRNPYESLVVVNSEGKLIFMDKGSEKFLGLVEGEAKGKKITDLIPDSGIPKILESGVPTIGRIFDVNGIRRIGSNYPLIRNGMIVGALGRLIFHSLEEVERINSKVSQLKGQVKSLQEKERNHHYAIYTFEDILGTSVPIKGVIELAKKAAMTDTDVLIIGESGTGKELLAQAIHNFVKPEKPFVSVNSSAIPFELAESVLFGYEKGTFTGASPTGKPGKFEIARNGTFFLDEISCLPLSIQAKLLRVLQEREVERLGSTRAQKIDFRLIGASNTDLRTLVKQGKFREDFYYRLAKIIIKMPPLRNRTQDIPFYVNHFLKTINGRFGTRFERLTNEALSCLMDYPWPGNVRELINVLEQACIKKWEGTEIPMSSLPSELMGDTRSSISSSSKRMSSYSPSFKKDIREREKMMIIQALEETKGNKRRAAIFLGMPRSTLYNKIKEYQLEF